MDDDSNLTQQEIIKKYSNIIYNTSNSIFGKETTKIQKDEIKGLNGKFTNNLSAAGMWRNQGLNCTCDKERYVKGSKDWMDNLS